MAGLVLGTFWTADAPRILDPVLAQELLLWLLAAVAVAGFAVVRLEYSEPTTVSERRFRGIYRGLDAALATSRTVRFAPFGPGRAYWALTGVRRDHLSHLRSPLWGYLAAVGPFSVSFSLFWAAVPAYLTEVGLATGAVFILFLASNVGATACFGRVGAVSLRIGATGAQTGALVARAVLFPLVAVVGGWSVGLRTPLLVVVFLAVGATWAVVGVTAYRPGHSTGGPRGPRRGARPLHRADGRRHRAGKRHRRRARRPGRLRRHLPRRRCRRPRRRRGRGRTGAGCPGAGHPSGTVDGNITFLFDNCIYRGENI